MQCYRIYLIVMPESGIIMHVRSVLDVTPPKINAVWVFLYYYTLSHLVTQSYHWLQGIYFSSSDDNRLRA